MFKIILIAWVLLLAGCATPDHIIYARYLKVDCPPRSCLQQALLYADFIGGEAYSNGKHAFAVKDGKIYDSTNMDYTGYSIDNWQVRKVYGKDWKRIK